MEGLAVKNKGIPYSNGQGIMRRTQSDGYIGELSFKYGTVRHGIERTILGKSVYVTLYQEENVVAYIEGEMKEVLQQDEEMLPRYGFKCHQKKKHDH